MNSTPNPWRDALCSLVPLGVALGGDPQRCADFLRGRLERAEEDNRRLREQLAKLATRTP